MAGGNAPEQSIDLGAISERLQEINRFARAAQTSSSSSTTSTTTSGAIDPDAVATPIDKGDASPAASEQSESKSSSLDELSLSDEDNGEDRNKRCAQFYVMRLKQSTDLCFLSFLSSQILIIWIEWRKLWLRRRWIWKLPFRHHSRKFDKRNILSQKIHMKFQR